jgi:hypothetical protein
MNSRSFYKKGGRPTQEVKRNQLLGVKCTHLEKFTIEAHARSHHLSVSEYLRLLGLQQGGAPKAKHAPSELLQFSGQLCQLVSQLNALSNHYYEAGSIHALEWAQVQTLCKETLQFLHTLKTHFL